MLMAKSSSGLQLETNQGAIVFNQQIILSQELNSLGTITYSQQAIPSPRTLKNSW